MSEINYKPNGVSPFLYLSYWGAGSGSSSSAHCYLFENFKYVEKYNYFNICPILESNGIKIMHTQNASDEYIGTLPEEKYNEIVKFLDENIKENSESSAQDAGCKIIYVKGDQEITIINHWDLFEKIRKLIPYNVRELDKKESKQ